MLDRRRQSMDSWCHSGAGHSRVGFADGAALAKAVRRWAGYLPAEYRKRLASETAGPIPDSPRVRS